MTGGGTIEVTAGRPLGPDEQQLIDAYARVVALAFEREPTPLRSR